MCVRLGIHNEVLLEGILSFITKFYSKGILSFQLNHSRHLPHEQLESSSTKVKATEHMGQKSAGMTQSKVADELTKMAPPIMAIF